jgi:hypothetical protein
MMTYAEKLRCNKTRVAFFSSTPQGGGVALMRHALIRFARRIGVDMSWYGKLYLKAWNMAQYMSCQHC